MKVEIKEPCGENWDNMKIGLISRHCESCNKDVMDFTQKSRSEILLYILSNQDKSICGRMNSSQFDFHHDDIPILIEAFKTNKTTSNNAFMILALVCLSLASCSSDNSGKKSSIDPPKESRILNDSIGITKKGEIKTDSKNESKVEVKSKSENRDLIGLSIVDPIITTEGEIVCVLPEPPIVEPTEMLGKMVQIQPENRPLKFAEKMPEYSGGMDAMFIFINKNIIYPKSDFDLNISGTVYIKMIINEDGSISAPTILRGINDHPNFDFEALRVVNLMPHWIPGENQGMKVKVEYTIPIKFK